MPSPHAAPPISTAQDLLDRVDTSALQPMVEQVLQIGPLRDLTYHLHREIQGAKGYSGLTCIVSVAYSDGGACSGWMDLVLKWSRYPTREASWYPALMAAQAPVPRLLGSVRLREPPAQGGQEVLVLEYLPHIGNGERDRLALAQTLGRFHALTPELFPELPQVTAAGSVANWTEVWQRIPIHARAGELGPAIAELVVTQAAAWDRVLGVLPTVAAAADRLPRGVVHRDVSIQNTGWRSDRTQLLLFDLPQMAVGILAQDAHALFPAEQPLDATVALRYLSSLRDHGGVSLSLGDLTHAVVTMQPLAHLNFLWWATARSCDGKVDFSSDIEEGRRWYRRTLLSILEQLLHTLGRP